MEQQFDLPQLQTDPETFRRVWSRVMPDQENSPLVVVSQPQPSPGRSPPRAPLRPPPRRIGPVRPRPGRRRVPRPPCAWGRRPGPTPRSCSS